MRVRRPSFFLLISVKVEDLRHRIILPIPLGVVDAVLAAGGGVLTVAKYIKPEWHRKTIEKIQIPDLPKDMLPAIKELWSELRSCGPMTLVDVTEGKGTRVSIRLV